MTFLFLIKKSNGAYKKNSFQRSEVVSRATSMTMYYADIKLRNTFIESYQSGNRILFHYLETLKTEIMRGPSTFQNLNLNLNLYLRSHSYPLHPNLLSVWANNILNYLQDSHRDHTTSFSLNCCNGSPSLCLIFQHSETTYHRIIDYVQWERKRWSYNLVVLMYLNVLLILFYTIAFIVWITPPSLCTH